MEGGTGLVLADKRRADPNDVVIQIAETEEDQVTQQVSGSQSSPKNFEPSSSNAEIAELDPDHSYKNQPSVFTGSVVPDMSPQGQSLTRRKSIARSMNSYESGDAKLVEASVELMSTPMTHKLLISSDDEKEEEKPTSSRDNEKEKKQKMGPPLIEMEEMIAMSKTRKQNEEEAEKGEAILVSGKRTKMKKISAWTMEKLINHICSTPMSIVSDQISDGVDDEEEGKIESELQATAASYYIFRNVAQPGCNYVDEEDLLRFFTKAEVYEIMLKLGPETGRFKRSDLKKWVVNVYEKRRSLARYLNNSKEAMQELNGLFTGIMIVLITIVWLLIVGLLTTKVLVLILSQLVLAAFLFGNTAKNVFEAIIFLFLTHPFDVGDRCVIDGVEMVVEEMHILTTMFMRYDKEKIFYPNSVLATKPISNYYRSTVDMRDVVEFAIDVSTPIEKVECLKSKIKNYLEDQPQNWSPKHSVVVKQIKDEKMIMGLYVTHTIIFEKYEEKIQRRSALVLEIKKIFEDLDIRFSHVLPQEVYVSYGAKPTSTVPPSEN